MPEQTYVLIVQDEDWITCVRSNIHDNIFIIDYDECRRNPKYALAKQTELTNQTFLPEHEVKRALARIEPYLVDYPLKDV